MNFKWIGALLVVAGCGCAGLSIAAGYKKQACLLRQLIQILSFMRCQLQFKLTPLPELCEAASREGSGLLREIFKYVSDELNQQIAPDVCSCMSAALERCENVPYSLRRQLLSLGNSLGRFDLPGQLQGLKSVERDCQQELNKINQLCTDRIRAYQTLGFCAGAAMVIIFV